MGTDWTLEIAVPGLPPKKAFLPTQPLHPHSQIQPLATVSPHTSETIVLLRVGGGSTQRGFVEREFRRFSTGYKKVATTPIWLL